MVTPWARWSEFARACAAVGAVFLVGVLAEWRSSGFEELSVWVPDLAVGVTLAIAGRDRVDERGRARGVAGGLRRPDVVRREPCSRTHWSLSHGPQIISALVHRALLFEALVAFPLGVVRGRAERTLVGVAYAGALLLAVVAREWWVMLWATGLFVGYVIVVARRNSLARAASVRALPAMVILWATLIAVAVLRLTHGVKPVPRVTASVYEIGIVIATIVLVVRVVEWRNRTAEVADAVVEVTYGPAGSVRDLLAHALRDPTVEVAFAVPGDDADAWVDELGRPMVPLSVGGRAVTPISVDGEPVAEIASAVDFQTLPGVLAAVSSATRLAAENARLRSRLRRQIDVLEASRLRLLSVADEERLRLARQLDRGAGSTITQIRSALGTLVRPATTPSTLRRSAAWSASTTWTTISEGWRPGWGRRC